MTPSGETRALGFRPAPMRSLPPRDRTVPRMLELRARADGDRPLVRCAGVERSVAGMRAAAAGAGSVLRSAGVVAGDRVVLMCANRIELLDAMLGCAWIGATAVPLNPAARGPQLEHMLGVCGPRLVVADADVLPTLERTEIPATVDGIWTPDEVPADPPQGARARHVRFDAAGSDPAGVRPRDTAAVLFTSGTTGPAKGVRVPHGQLHAFAVNACELLEIGREDVLYTCLPLHHVNALSTFFQALVSGATFVVDRKFSATRYWNRAADAGATVTYLLPAMVGMLVSRDPHDGERAHRLRVINGAVASEQMQEAIRRRFGVAIRECYASTEVGMALGAAPGRERPGWMGPPLSGYEARVAGDLDEPLAPGTSGQLLIRPRVPDTIFTGYLGMDEATVSAWRNGWFHTGDRVVESEADGSLRFLDRLTDSIRRRGENISAWEVEEVVGSHPAVAQVAAFAVPSEIGEDEVMIAVVPRPGQVVDADALARHTERLLAPYAVPRYVEVVDELPMTDTGKIRKVALRERGVTATTWDRCPPGRPSAPA